MPDLHLVGTAEPERLTLGDTAMLARCSELHVLADLAIEELRAALRRREAASCAASARRLYSIGVLFGDAARKHGSL